MLAGKVKMQRAARWRRKVLDYRGFPERQRQVRQARNKFRFYGKSLSLRDAEDKENHWFGTALFSSKS
jgi:hypothetical protein